MGDGKRLSWPMWEEWDATRELTGRLLDRFPEHCIRITVNEAMLDGAERATVYRHKHKTA